MKSIRKKWYIYFSLLLFIRCTHAPKPEQNILPLEPHEVATLWADMTLYISRYTFANTPTYSSRALGYIGLAMYESVVWSDSHYQSLANQLNGLHRLPQPEAGKRYNWLLALNAGQQLILKTVYTQTSDNNKARIDSLARVIYDQVASHEVDKEVISRSVAYGEAVANAIFEWSKTDGGYRGYLHNFDPQYTVLNRPGSWKPALYSQIVGHLPLHPYWGKNRTFVRADSEIPSPSFIPHSPSDKSPCYQQFFTVYQKNKNLTQEEKEIALWWNDDPSETFTPPGHSYNLATIVLKTTRPDLVKCAETYARVGIAVADAFIDCWKWKYFFISERPSTYVNDVIDPEWISFWPDPPFPAFPSGHSIQAAATAIVLTDLYGDHVSFADDSYSGRMPDTVRNVEYKTRHFSSFWQVAEETAQSRLLGGIHTAQDNVVGLEKGKEIGKNVNQLNWHN